MTQAARSGCANIAEGSARRATSAETEMNLTDVARSSLAELAGDYLNWLMQQSKVPWGKNTPEAREIYASRLDKPVYGPDVVHDACAHILAQERGKRVLGLHRLPRMPRDPPNPGIRISAERAKIDGLEEFKRFEITDRIDLSNCFDSPDSSDPASTQQSMGILFLGVLRSRNLNADVPGIGQGAWFMNTHGHSFHPNILEAYSGYFFGQCFQKLER